MGQQVAALSQTAAIAGLGGIGKTQTAIEYAYRYHPEVYEWVFWVRADTELNVVTGLAEIARSLELGEGKLEELANLALRWLATNPGWLLIFDNADEPKLLKPWLPKNPQGRVLLTSRARQFVGLGIKAPIELKKLSLEESITFLQNRCDRPELSEAEQEAITALARELDGLPLALEQTAAYIQQMGVSFAVYWKYYQQRRLELLEKVEPETGDYPETVATTWLLNFEEVAKRSPGSVPILRLSAVLAADDIAEWMLLEGAEAFGLTDCTDELALAERLSALADFSLISRDQLSQSYSIHRMVQEVVWQGLTAAEQQEWLQRAISGLNVIFPRPEFGNWAVCGSLVPHVQEIAARQGTEILETIKWARLLNQVGIYLHHQGQFEDSELLCQRALRISEAQLGPDHPDTATSLNNLALLYKSMGRYGEAEPLFQRALVISKAHLGSDHLDTATSLNNLAVLYDSMGRYGEAEPLFQRALQIHEAQLGPDHPDTATNLNNLASLYKSMGRYGEAEPLFQRALQIHEAQLSPDHPDTATNLNNLALLYDSMGRYGEAEPLFQRALQIHEAQLGPDHPDTATNLNNLALLYKSMGRYGEAEPLFQRALQIHEAQLGPDHPDTATNLNNLALLYKSMGRYGEAEPLFQRALQIHEAQLGPDHPDTATNLNNLALLYKSMGRYGEAESLYLRALKIWTNTLGEAHPNTQTAWNNYCYLLQQALITGQANELSNHPTTQTILAQSKAQREYGT